MRLTTMTEMWWLVSRAARFIFVVGALEGRVSPGRADSILHWADLSHYAQNRAKLILLARRGTTTAEHAIR
jgi:hypothetical protein